MTFALSWGWIHFTADEVGRYGMHVWGLRVLTFAPFTWFAWLVFHLLDIAAVLVIAGCGYFLWRRLRDREVRSEQRLGYDFLPLVALVAISVTGLLLTFSSVLLGGACYDFLAMLHMGVVVLTLVFIPFGKFFHVDPAPRRLGVQVFKQVSRRMRVSRPAVAAGHPSRVSRSSGTCRRRWTNWACGTGDGSRPVRDASGSSGVAPTCAM